MAVQFVVVVQRVDVVNATVNVAFSERYMTRRLVPHMKDGRATSDSGNQMRNLGIVVRRLLALRIVVISKLISSMCSLLMDTSRKKWSVVKVKNRVVLPSKVLEYLVQLPTLSQRLPDETS